MNKRPKFRMVSGASVGKRRTKIVACDHCNHAEPVKAKTKAPKQGSTCARCKNDTVRVFDSKAEYTYHVEINADPNITDIEYQVRYDLHAPDFETGTPVKVCTFVADFTYFTADDDEFHIIDVKGGNSESVVITPEAKLKIDWLEKEYGVPVTIIGR